MIWLLKYGDESEEEGDIALLYRKFKEFMWRNTMTSRKFEKDEKDKEEKMNKIQCYERKEYRHMKHVCSNMEREGKKYDLKEKKVLTASIESNDEHKEIKEALIEFCFMIEEEKDEDRDELQQAFEDDKYSIMIVKKNKELKNMMESMANENKELKEKVASMEKDLEQSTSMNKDLKEKNKEMLKLL